MTTKAKQTYSKHNKAPGKAKPQSKEQALDIGFMGSREEWADTRTVASRKRLHEQMSDDVEAFLARGGQINHIEPHVTADPPKRPVSHYGQRPI